MKQMIVHNSDITPTTVESHGIARDKQQHMVFRQVKTKKFRVVNDKRVLLPDYTSRPFGTCGAGETRDVETYDYYTTPYAKRIGYK